MSGGLRGLRYLAGFNQLWCDLISVRLTYFGFSALRCVNACFVPSDNACKISTEGSGASTQAGLPRDGTAPCLDPCTKDCEHYGAGLVGGDVTRQP